MKRILLFLFSVILSVNVWAQSLAKSAHAAVKHDVIVKTNGEELTGKIMKMNEHDIVFVHSGETLEYTIKKSEIAKITHASGRVEVINKPMAVVEHKPAGLPASTAEERRNKIAIMPFGYIKDQEKGGEEIGLKAQNEAYAYMLKHTAGLHLLDPRTTNAMLIKHGITKDKLAGYTVPELCSLLGVEYLIEGTVTQTKTAQTAYSSSNHNSTSKKEKDDKTKHSGSGSSYSSATQSYQMAVSINISDDKNKSLYSENREAFFLSTSGDFSGPMEYLLKRCPLYRKN